MSAANPAPAGAPFATGERVNVLYASRIRAGMTMELNRTITAVLPHPDGVGWAVAVELPPDAEPEWGVYRVTPEGWSSHLVRSSRSKCAACTAHQESRPGEYCAWHEDERTDP